MATHVSVVATPWRAKKRTRKKATKQLARAFVRDRDNSRLCNLLLDVNELKQQIYDLAARKHALQTRSLYTRLDLQGVVLKTVHQYFELLARGLNQGSTACAFIASIAAPQMSLGLTTHGLDMLLEQWRRYTELFHPHSYSLVSADVIVGMDQSYIIRASVVLRGVFTHQTLATVFPLTLWDPIVWNRLIGRELVCPMVFHMHFNANGKLVRHDVETDFFAAVDRVLQDPRVTASIMENAIVAEESMVTEIISCHDQPLRVSSSASPVDEVDTATASSDNASSRLAVAYLLS
ncbi:hypothetical protein Poli38472_011751 [Pythium oligandrum]|uniref:Uncharacterized protein n=1 Tax=Pythium oligandrum TaxID=41045 RepID=A0A8K1C8I6_PYTOL|nr:hypothetical protein Poli38472_011751 [Pythium oligandrum]|eukprot:TMW58163.1 hypothetical protein Poli38472_011751 [Pythium oligandrum]